MKYCSKCGAELLDEAVICPSCGCSTEEKKHGNTTLLKIAFVLMILTCVSLIANAVSAYGEEQEIFLISVAVAIVYLLWSIPMTISLGIKIKKGKSISTSFKVCTLLFVNILAGILLLCYKED